MNTKDYQQAIAVLQKAGVKVKKGEKGAEEQGELIEFTVNNMEKMKSVKNPVRYLDEKITFLEELYGKEIWNKSSYLDPLLMADSHKAGILKTLRQDAVSGRGKKI
ncbi:MAG: hypothetical protein WCP97_01965 [bacterium]